MVYSAKKPYMKTKGAEGSRRHLKQGVGPESVFEKPYKDPEYQEMNQAPTIPDVDPPVGGSGGLVCLYSPNECEIDVECYAGPEIKIVDGPEETEAGYEEPEVLEGALVSWTVGEDSRLIQMVLDPNVPKNLVSVNFRDGWGKVWNELVDITCTYTPVPIYPGATTDFGRHTISCSSPPECGDPLNIDSESYTTPIGETSGVWGSVGGGNWQERVIKFNNLQINQGQSISLAILRLYKDVINTNANAYFEIFGLDEDNGDIPADLTEWQTDQSSNLTSANTYWDTTADLVGFYDSPDIASIINEIINRPGWSRGNDIVLFLKLYLFPSFGFFGAKNFYFHITDSSYKPRIIFS